MEPYILLGILFILIWMSIRLRSTNRKRVSGQYEFEPIDSPFSKSVVELISISGGIYLSLTLGLSFLKIDYSPMYTFLDVEFDFLAALSIVIAVFQPVIIYLYNKVTGK